MEVVTMGRKEWFNTRMVVWMTWIWGYIPPWIGNLNLEFSMENASVNGEMIGIIDIEKGI